MSGDSFEVPPLSRIQIRDMARRIRALAKELLGTDDPYFKIVQFLDIGLPKVLSQFQLDILTKNEMGSNHGMTYPDRHLIEIRDDVYERAFLNHGRDRLTLAHELGHYVLHSGIGLARSLADSTVKPYRQSEWQANAFGGELLISADHIHLCNSPHEAALKFGVSLEAAETQWRVFKKNNLVK